MGSHHSVGRILTDFTTTSLSREVIDRRKYEIFHDELTRHLCGLMPFFVSGQAYSFLHIAALVSREISPIRMEEQGAATWADFATVVRNALVTTFGARADNSQAALRIVMLTRSLWSDMRGPLVVVRRKRVRLAERLVQFVLDEAEENATAAEEEEEEEAEETEDVVEEGHSGPEQGGEVVEEVVPAGPEQGGEVVEEVVPAGPEQGGEVVEEVVPAGPEQGGEVVEEVVPAGPEQGGEVVEEEVPAGPEQGGEVVEEEVPAGPEQGGEVVEEEEVLEPDVDEDGDVVMDTRKETEGRGSKRRSRDLSYDEDLTRAREAKRRYGLRSTRAREERLERLKENDGAKRKADDGAGSPSKGSRKKSRR